MVPDFKAEYKKAPSKEKRKRLYLANPEKCLVLQYLLKYHENRGDKVYSNTV